MTVLHLENVTVTYSGGTVALEPTTLEFKPGEFTVLVGASGAGKSTLLRSINGLIQPTGGDVRTDRNGSIFASPRVLRSHRSRTGMIFQQHHLIGRLTALTNVLMGRLAAHSPLRSIFPLPRADGMLALGLLDRVGLMERALDRADRLSGGQQQRVGIARAMAQQPEIILADEPIASLDPTSAERVLGDLHRICREDRITAVVSLHQIDFAQRYADRVIGLARGRIVFDGPPALLSSHAIARIYDHGVVGLAEAAE